MSPGCTAACITTCSTVAGVVARSDRCAATAAAAPNAIEPAVVSDWRSATAANTSSRGASVRVSTPAAVSVCRRADRQRDDGGSDATSPGRRSCQFRGDSPSAADAVTDKAIDVVHVRGLLIAGARRDAGHGRNATKCFISRIFLMGYDREKIPNLVGNETELRLPSIRLAFVPPLLSTERKMQCRPNCRETPALVPNSQRPQWLLLPNGSNLTQKSRPRSPAATSAKQLVASTRRSCLVAMSRIATTNMSSSIACTRTLYSGSICHI
ncbi:Uncharacterised protein [Xylophilus ampelinus]|nr:Uncharacterised protein [Xylophilus ampelinus]